jgi:hypothetical protein
LWGKLGTKIFILYYLSFTNRWSNWSSK